MKWNKDINEYFELQKCYSDMYVNYCECNINTILDDKDKECISKEGWYKDHYFQTGADALRIIVSALLNNKRPPPKAILDFPSGSGRVTRHLTSFFPEARITACDLYDYHVEFCMYNFGVDGQISDEFLDQINFEDEFDLIFCGSLFTHLPQEDVRHGLALITRSLSENGIAVVTFHGRYSIVIQDNKFKYIEDHLFDIARREFIDSKFGYVAYNHNFKRIFDKQASYGVTLFRPSWVMSELETSDEVRILGYHERCWDDHQDVLVFGKPGINQ